jgi:tetratricopeptide (TPR) repeat protein
LEEDMAAWIWAGRHLGYLGRYRAAVEHFSLALDHFGDHAELLRHRGHRHITLRRFEEAEADLARAWQLIAKEPDRVEPDGLPNEAGVPRSTLKTNVLYHLALARYLQGDFGGAASAWNQCLAISPNDDMRVAAAYWLANSLRRDGRGEEAARAIAFIRPQMDIIENDSYHRLLLHYRGELDADGVRGEVVAGTVDSPTVGYGLAQELLHRGEAAAARAALEGVTSGEVWAAFGFIAAEADLARR